MSEPGQQKSSPGNIPQNSESVPTVYGNDTLKTTGLPGLVRVEDAAGGRVSTADEPPAPVQSNSTTGRSLAQILVILVVLLMLVNIPFKNDSAGLAQLKPDAKPVVIRDGMLLQGSSPEIYLLDDHRLRRIGGPEALDSFFRRTQQITVVDDSLLAQFGQGPPVRQLLRCRDNPTIYAVENGRKYRFEGSLPTSSAKPWDQVQLVSCNYLNQLATGPEKSAGAHDMRTEFY